MNETKYRKQALRMWSESREQTKDELAADVRTMLAKFTALFKNIKARLSHHKPG